MSTLDTIPGIGPAMRASLEALGIRDIADLARAEAATLTQVRGISPTRAEAFVARAREMGGAARPAAAEAPAQETGPAKAKAKGKDKGGKKADKPKDKKKDKDKKKAKDKKKSAKTGKKKKA